MGNNTKDTSPSEHQVENTFRQDQLEESKNWDAADWEKYLSSTELPIAEKQIDVDHFDRIASLQSESIFSFSQESSSPELFAKLQNALFTLTPQQQAVIDLLFFKSRSHREAARKLSISQSRVRDLRNHALKKLKSELQRGALTLPLVDKQKKEKENVEENFGDVVDFNSTP